MAWRIEVDDRAAKEIKALGPQAATRIFAFLNGRLAVIADPRTLGEAMKGRAQGRRWKYRVGPYRVLCTISDETETITVAQVGDRKEVYR